MVSVEAVMEYSQIGGYGSYGGGDGGEIDGDYGGCGGGGDGGGIDSGYGGGGYGGGSSGGSGSSSGDGSGGGYGGVDIKTINGLHTVIIDSTLTALTNIRGNVAKGFIVNVNLTLEPCYVAKQDNLFSHGKSIKSAMAGLMDKLFEDMSEEERIDMFWKEHDIESEYQALDLYEWHNKLTGSCELGRRSFCKNHNIDLNKDRFTVKQFVELCRNDYGGDVIRKLLKED